MRLEEITNDNLESALRMARAIFPYEIHADGFWPELAYRASIEKKELDFKYFIAFSGSIPVGICGHYQEDGDLWLGWFGVLPKWRKLGYGRAILLCLGDLVRDMGHSSLRLYTGDRPEEAAALALYQKFGFVLESYGVVDGAKVLHMRSDLLLKNYWSVSSRLKQAIFGDSVIRCCVTVLEDK